VFKLVGRSVMQIDLEKEKKPDDTVL
jgi:hypothetical protein